jgi:hypothetical protein
MNRFKRLKAIRKRRIFRKPLRVQLKTEPAIQSDLLDSFDVARLWAKRQSVESMQNLVLLRKNFLE